MRQEADSRDVMMQIQGAKVWNTQFYLQITPCLPRKRSPDGGTTDL